MNKIAKEILREGFGLEGTVVLDASGLVVLRVVESAQLGRGAASTETAARIAASLVEVKGLHLRLQLDGRVELR
jgi:hypothetical protein